MAFLTKSNSLKIIARIDFQKIGNLEGEIYIKPIYFFSNYEKNNLLGLKELLINPEKFIKEYYVPIKNTDNFKYVFEGGYPAYHAKSECERLNSNYKNFEIPEQVREKGKEEVIKFRAWFKENQQLLEKPEVFAARLQMAFGASINPKSVDYENSGVEEKENLNLEELEIRINKIISNAGQYFKNADQEKKDIIRKFQKYTFLAYSTKAIQNNNTRFSENAIKKFLLQYDSHFKRPIKNLLIEYYRVKYNPELKFQGNLLEQLGFRPCSACHQNSPENYLINETTNENDFDDLPF